MDAPVVLIVTFCAEAYVPAVGLNVGVATGGRIVNTAEVTALSAIPEAYAIAFSVVVVLTETGPEYSVPFEGVGELPSVV